MMNYYTFDDLVKIDRNNREKLYKEMRKVVLGESEKPETAYWINEDCTWIVKFSNIMGFFKSVYENEWYFIDENGRTDLVVDIKDRIKWLDFCDADKTIISKERTWAIKECFIKEYKREGKRVIAVTKANNNFLVGDFESKEEAIAYMKRLVTGVLD